MPEKENVLGLSPQEGLGGGLGSVACHVSMIGGTRGVSKGEVF